MILICKDHPHGRRQPGKVPVSNLAKGLVAGSGITFTDRGTHIL